MRAGLVVHGGRQRALDVAAEVVKLCADRGIDVRSEDDVEVGAPGRVPGADVAEGADVVLSVGGDGTLLRAAFVAAPAGVPVLGVNVGRLGFLTEVEADDLAPALDAFLAGDLVVDERIAVEAEAEGTEWHEPQWALNEIMVEKRARHRVITLATRVGEEYVTTISGDGVIVATPTGSTAYSFSSRGPIVEPAADCLVITPVAPHMVFDRSLVLPPDAEVTLVVEGEEPGLLAADGRRSLAMPVGSRVRIRRSEHPARLLRRPETETFFAKLRRKFSLPGG